MTEIKNASELLNRNYLISSKKGNYTKQQIDNATNQLKQKIWDNFQGTTTGRIVYLYTNELFWIVAALRASWQLGCTVFAADYNPAYGRIPEFKKFHEFIDLVIGHDQAHQVPCDVFPHKPRIIFETCDTNQQTADLDLVSDSAFDRDQPAVTTHTSGTTGYPKLVHYSHREVIELARSQVKMSRMHPDEFAGHNRTLHHGSLFLNYALPLLSICDKHYCFFPQHNPNWTEPHEPIQDLLDQVSRLGLSRIMIPYNWIRYASQLTGPDLGHAVTVHTIIGPSKEEMRRIFASIKPRTVINMWGCSEIGSCFHSMTDQENLNSYAANRFEIINPDLDFAIEPDCIKLKWKFSKTWQVVGDRFEMQDHVLWWQGRVNFIQRQQRRIDANRMKDVLEKTFNTVHFSIVLDYELHRLYLASWDQTIPTDLESLNTTLARAIDHDHVFDAAKQLPYRELLMGMKPSQPILLYMFRNDQPTP